MDKFYLRVQRKPFSFVRWYQMLLCGTKKYQHLLVIHVFFIKSAYPGYKNKTIFSPVKQRTNHIVHISLPKPLSNAL